jgi:two-component system sensor histidine kinase ChiS
LSVNLAAVALHDVVDVVVALTRPLLGDKAVTIRTVMAPDLPPVLADPQRLQQILHNLVGNAAKFTDRGEITIAAMEVSLPPGLRGIEIAVSDTGVGIPHDRLDRIFEPFDQAEEASTQFYGGSGLGLAITRKLVELHGGTMRVESHVGRGSRFAFTLRVNESESEETTEVIAMRRFDHGPQAAAEAEARALVRPKSPTELDRNRVRLLVVDDDPVNLAVLVAQLEPEGFTVCQAHNGQEALEQLRTDTANSGGDERAAPFDMVLLDVMMPGMSGFEVCERIRKTYTATRLPVLLLTAKNQVGDLVHGFDAGANDYLSKPFSKRELLARVGAHLHVSQNTRAVQRFVPKELLRLLGRGDAADVRLGDHSQRELTVMFCDLRAALAASNRSPSPDALALINEVHARVGPLVRGAGGILDKYPGDALIALFADRADSALSAATQVVRALSKPPQGAGAHFEGWHPEGIHVGIHSGAVLIGAVGDGERVEAAVVSDAVAVAARLELPCAALGARILLTSAARASLAEPDRFTLRRLGRAFGRKGTERTELFELLDAEPSALREAKRSTRSQFAAAIEDFERQRFDEALYKFEEILERTPEDGAAAYYRDQCRSSSS